MRGLLFLLLVLTSCSVPDKESLNVLMETKKLRRSPVTLTARSSGGGTDDKLELRENNIFNYESTISGRQQSVFYAGSFTKNGDTLLLNFHNNHKDSLWTGRAMIDTAKKEITLFAGNAAFNKRMTITRMK